MQIGAERTEFEAAPEVDANDGSNKKSSLWRGRKPTKQRSDPEDPVTNLDHWKHAESQGQSYCTGEPATTALGGRGTRPMRQDAGHAREHED